MTRSSKNLMAFAGLAFGTLLGGALAVRAAERLYNYDYDRGRSTAVLVVTLQGMQSMKETVYSVFGDGAVEIQTQTVAGEHRVLDSYIVSVGEEAVEGLVADAVNSGLAEMDPSEIEREAVERSGRQPPQVDDGLNLHFAINLTYLAVDAEPSVEPFSHQFGLSYPRERATAYPDCREYLEIEALRLFLDEVHQRALGERR